MTSSVSPVHSIHEYGNGIYKVVTFKGVRDPDNAYFRQSENVQHNDKKLDNTHAFDAAVSAKLEQAFPVYQYTSLDALTSLPDGNYRVSWSGDASAISIKYQTYSKFFVYLSNQLTYNRNWLDKRLGQLSFSTGDVTVSPTDLTDVVGRMDTIIDLLQNTAGDAACEHTYKQDMTTDATCTLPGLMVSTCSQCGDSYSEIVDPLGHDWKCTDHVAAVTDPETGEETAAAYSCIKC